jgi:hypothetical protein
MPRHAVGSLRCFFPCGANPSSLARKADDRAWVINSLTDRIAAVAGAFPAWRCGEFESQTKSERHQPDA